MKLELSHVSKRFGRVRALDDVTVAVPSGRRVALIGPNGSGKSTLTRALMGLVRVSGELRLDGRTPARDRVGLMRRVAYVPQIAPQLKAPVEELLRTICDVRDLDSDDLEAVAAALGLELRPLLGRPFRALSGGMKQKLLISLALATRADLYVLDEPTASLDAAARERFFSLFEQRAAGATLILCSHRLEEIRHLVDHVLALDEGRVVYDGPAAEFLARSAFSVLEVRVDNGTYAGWLEERGFTPRPGGWWANTVAHEDKMGLLTRVSEELGQKLQNVLVRDLEALETDTAERGRLGGGGES